jgi:hypothetical protein
MTFPKCEDGYNKRKLTLFASQVVDDFKNLPPPSANSILEAIAKFKGVWWFFNSWYPENALPNFTKQSGSIGWNDFYARLETGEIQGSSAYINKTVWAFSYNPTWEKKRVFKVEVYVPFNSYQIIHLVSGFLQAPDSSDNPSPHIGFKIVNNEIYGTVGDGNNESTLLLDTISEEGYEIGLECVLIPSQECRFYVNGEDKGSVETNLPQGIDGSDMLFASSIFNPQPIDRYIDIFEVRVFQEE